MSAFDSHLLIGILQKESHLTMKTEFEYGAFKIEISEESGNFKLLVWDRQIQQPIGCIVCEQDRLSSIEAAKDAAAECIATDL